MSETPGTRDDGPYPDLRAALLLTVGAILATGFVAVFFFGLGPVAAIGLGHGLAVGAIATLAAKRVAEPQAERIGLTGFDLGALPLILCLGPAILLASEVDNWATDWSPQPVESVESFEYPDSDTFEGLDPDDASATSSDTDGTSESAEIQASEARETPETREPIELGIDPTDPWTIAQAFVIYVGIAPVVEEFFFRGVLQQGAVARLGLVRGVGFVALLYTLFHLPAVPVASRFLMGALSSFGLGCLLGLVRAATGSILGPMLLASVWAAVGILAFALEERLPLQGMNVPGTHLPVLITLASGALVAWVAQTLYQEALRRSNDPPQEAAP